MKVLRKFMEPLSKSYYHIQNYPPLDPNLSHLNPVHIVSHLRYVVTYRPSLRFQVQSLISKYSSVLPYINPKRVARSAHLTALFSSLYKDIETSVDCEAPHYPMLSRHLLLAVC